MQEKRTMVFVSNLRTLDDMTGLFPESWHERVLAARASTGFIASPAFDILGRATGYLVLMLRSGEEVVKDPREAASITLDMTRFAAEQLDADVIGLGSLTTSVTSGGRKVADFIGQHGWKLRATHGDAGSTAAILDCLHGWGPARSEKVAVVGAYGVIGSALSRILAKDGVSVILHGRQQSQLDALMRQIEADGGGDVTLSTEIGSVREADYVITVTSHPTSVLNPSLVKPGAIIIDPAVPANTSNDTLWLAPEHRNLVISNASQVRVPNVEVQSAMFGTFDDPDGCATTYACMAETMLAAVVGDTDHHVGPIELPFVRTVARRLNEHGFCHAVHRMFGRPVSEVAGLAGV